MLNRTAAILGFAFLLAVTLLSAPGQYAAPPQAKAKNETFSGHIVELQPDKLTVSRSILGGQAEKRIFLIRAATKIKGKLRMKAKVTVGFTTTDDGDVARMIVVRQFRR